MLRLMLVNVHTANQDHARVVGAVREASPDLILFEEVNSRWLARLQVLSTDYPERMAESRDDNFGIALFSRLPLQQPRIVYVGSAHVPSVAAGIPYDGKVLSFFGTHALPPASALGTRMRDDQLARVAEVLSGLELPKILLGDLNTTPWAHSFRLLLADAVLRDGRRGHGLHPTWPAAFWPMRIPIDHCLHSADVRILSLRTGSYVGSDHLPLIVELGF